MSASSAAALPLGRRVRRADYNVVSRNRNVAKKNTNITDQSSAAPVAPGKRRASAPKKSGQAAPPVDVATVGGTEPIESASDRGAGGAATATATDETTADTNGQYQPSHDEIAQAAYFRHLSRGGAEGDEFEDWLEAERELRECRK